MIKGIIFDMDGVIIDSNHIHYENWSNVFEKKFRKKIDKTFFAQHLGENPKDFTTNMITESGIDSTYEDLFPDIRENYMKFRLRINLKPGIKDALLRLKEKKHKIALATGAGKENAIDTLVRFGISDYFDYVVAGDEVKRAKPEPEIFLRAAEVLKLRPEECVVIEDAQLGLIAAKRAGMLAISIPDEFTKHQDHSMADIHLKSVSELDDEILKGGKHG